MRLPRGERGHEPAAVAEVRILRPVRPEARHREGGLHPALPGRPDDHDLAVRLDREVLATPEVRPARRPDDAVATEAGVERAVGQVPDDDEPVTAVGPRRDDPTVRLERHRARRVALRTEGRRDESADAEVGVERAAGQIAGDGEPAALPSGDHDLAVGLDGHPARRRAVGIRRRDPAGVAERWVEVAVGRAHGSGDECDEQGDGSRERQTTERASSVSHRVASFSIMRAPYRAAYWTTSEPSSRFVWTPVGERHSRLIV